MFVINAAGLFDAGTIFYLKQNAVFFLSAILFSMPIGKYIPQKMRESKLLNGCLAVAICAVFIVAISYMVKGGYNPFIYFNF